MRLRNIRGSRERIEENRFVINDPKSYRGRWRELFGNDRPLHIEIGMGKGKFISEMAALHPEINYLGIEKYSSVLIRALDKQEETEAPNLRFIRMEAEEVCEVFAPGEADRIYLNFSDPWPKDRHAKRRLTSREFLRRYDQILAEGGQIEFKTDNRPLFDFSVDEAREAGWQILVCTYDLHHSEFAEGNVMTEYEEKFSALGNPIHKYIICRKRRVTG